MAKYFDVKKARELGKSEEEIQMAMKQLNLQPLPEEQPTVSTTQPTTPIAEPTVQQPVDEPKKELEYIPVTGRTVEEHSTALSKAIDAGDKNAVSQIKQQYLIEQANYDKWSKSKQEEQALAIEKQKADVASKEAESKDQAAMELKSKGLEIAKDLKSRDFGNITGLQTPGTWTRPFSGGKPMFAGSKAQGTIAKFDQLKALLSLDNIKYLKGTGQISDTEQEILANAATSLNRNLSNEDFEKELNNVIEALGGDKAEGQELKKQLPEQIQETVKGLVESKDRNGIVEFFAGASLDMANDIAKALELRGKTGDDLFQSFDTNMDIANDLMMKLDSVEDPKQKEVIQTEINRLLDDVIKNAGEIDESFSKSNDQNYAWRGLQVGGEVGSLAALPGLVKSGISFLGNQSGKMFANQAGKQVVGEVGKKGTLAEKAFESGKPIIQKGSGILGKVQRGMDFIKNKMPSPQLAQKQAEAAQQATTNINIPERILSGAEKITKIDPDAAKQILKEADSVKNVKDIPTLLDAMRIWGRSAYTRGGDIKSTAKAGLYNDFYRTGLEILKTEAPEVYKYRRLLSYTHDLPRAAAKTLWRLTLGKVLLSGAN